MPIDPQRTPLLFQRLLRLLDQLPAKPVPERVHRLRTTVRRLETLLDALVGEPGRNQRKLMKQLGKVRRRAGRVRDLDVQMAALRSLKIGDSRRKAPLMQDLERARARRQKKLVQALDKATLRQLRRRIQRLLADLVLAGGSAAAAPAVAEADPVALALRDFARLVREFAPLNEQNLHDFRMRCKRLRYTAEMAGETPRVAEVVAPLKQIQDSIGAWHDWLVLSARAEKLFGGNGDVPLLAALRNVTRARYAEAVRTVADAKRRLLDLQRGQETGAKQVSRAPGRAPRRAAGAIA